MKNNKKWYELLCSEHANWIRIGSWFACQLFTRHYALYRDHAHSIVWYPTPSLSSPTHTLALKILLWHCQIVSYFIFFFLSSENNGKKHENSVRHSWTEIAPPTQKQKKFWNWNSPYSVFRVDWLNYGWAIAWGRGIVYDEHDHLF